MHTKNNTKIKPPPSPPPPGSQYTRKFCLHETQIDTCPTHILSPETTILYNLITNYVIKYKVIYYAFIKCKWRNYNQLFE